MNKNKNCGYWKPLLKYQSDLKNYEIMVFGKRTNSKKSDHKTEKTLSHIEE